MIIGYRQGDAAHSYEQSVDAHPDDYAWSEWPVYPDYDVGEHEGHKFVYAPLTDRMTQLRGQRRYRPLSRPTAALFLEFAKWPETEGMNLRPLESRTNESAAQEWAEIHGVLGLDSSEPFTVFGEAFDAAQHSLGVWATRPRIRNAGYGGPEETVEAFAREAWLANMTLRLYEAATHPEGPDVSSIIGFMADRNGGLLDFLPTERELHGRTPETARKWALSVVEEVVEDRMRGHVWPLPVRDHNRQGTYVGHKQGWAFDSLLGAMWLQMMWLMLGQGRRCEWCGRLLDVDPEQDLRIPGAVEKSKVGSRKPPSHKQFCNDTGGRCRAKWNYHYGTGKSSKAARRKVRKSGKP